MLGARWPGGFPFPQRFVDLDGYRGLTVLANRP